MVRCPRSQARAAAAAPLRDPGFECDKCGRTCLTQRGLELHQLRDCLQPLRVAGPPRKTIEETLQAMDVAADAAEAKEVEELATVTVTFTSPNTGIIFVGGAGAAEDEGEVERGADGGERLVIEAIEIGSAADATLKLDLDFVVHRVGDRVFTANDGEDAWRSALKEATPQQPVQVVFQRAAVPLWLQGWARKALRRKV